MQKPLHTLSTRMQRMRMRLQNYDLSVIHRSGKNMHIADALSRAHSVDTDPKNLFGDTLDVASVQISPQKLEEFRIATGNDTSLAKVIKATMDGWPNDIKESPPEIRAYYTYREEITYYEGILYKGDKLIVPQSLQSQMLSRIHEAHLGIVKSKQLARDLLFWPGMTSQIEEMIKQCPTCQMNRKAQPAEPLISHYIPDQPFAKVATDLFELQGKTYMLCVDYYSKYPDIALLPGTTSRSTIAALKATFARFGIPDEVISDNGPQFSSFEFKKFSDHYGFKHTTSSPYFSQSNGQAERCVQTVKNVIKKAYKSGQDPNIALLNYRNAPVDGVNKSPAQLLMNRRLNSRIPTNPQLLKPNSFPSVHKKLIHRQKKQKLYHDRHASNTMCVLKSGDTVRYKTHQGEWNLEKSFKP